MEYLRNRIVEIQEFFEEDEEEGDEVGRGGEEGEHSDGGGDKEDRSTHAPPRRELMEVELSESFQHAAISEVTNSHNRKPELFPALSSGYGDSGYGGSTDQRDREDNASVYSDNNSVHGEVGRLRQIR